MSYAQQINLRDRNKEAFTELEIFIFELMFAKSILNIQDFQLFL